MILLDTDHLNILQIGSGTQFERLIARMEGSEDTRFSTTVISFEEHMRGWLASIRRANDVARQVGPYAQLVNLVRFFQAWEIRTFNDVAVDRFNSLRQQRIRIGTMDLKIASIALANDAMLLSANLRDFKRVAALRVEDWLA